ncbi:TetR/AcrR family transcriptional regulator [Hoyosella subflava]|uniref:Putative TetR family transcriptional regulator n=1 Tax=Hoyosella subflava (strain DSM 45089 / JCM 17490 / NBRC 109087 / DQS3-9A1) TaxID=443218 RepID=F6EIE4_HOYSD|nr:TetR/AcrR family transcriptional regulator [Hoyosella subflava]AEF42436.1 Putative TetR family transcriptional regulator [Hoyosella subflava DQS3-9A1]
MSQKPAKDSASEDRRAVRWEAHKERRRLRILEGAVAAVEELGPDVGVGEIAKRSGVTRAVIYRFFRDRADLDFQIRTHIADEVVAGLMPTFTLDDTAELLIQRAIHTYIEWTKRHPNLHQFVGRRSSRDGSRGPDVATGAKTAMALQVSQMFTMALAIADRETDVAEPLAFALVGLVDSTVNRWRRQKGKGMTAERLETLLAQWIWQLIAINMEGVGVTIAPDVPVAEAISQLSESA